MKTKGRKVKGTEYRKGQVVFNVHRKAFGVIEDIETNPKGVLHTVKYVDAQEDEGRYGRYYNVRMESEFVAMKNTDMAYVLFGDD